MTRKRKHVRGWLIDSNFVLRRIYTVISVWPQECFVFILDAHRELQMSKGPTFHGAGRTHGVSPTTRETADARVWSQRVTTRQDRHNNLCHQPPPRKDRASPRRRRRTRISIFRAKPSRPRLIFQESPSSEGALRGRQIALGCDLVAPSVMSGKPWGVTSLPPRRLNLNILT